MPSSRSSAGTLLINALPLVLLIGCLLSRVVSAQELGPPVSTAIGPSGAPPDAAKICTDRPTKSNSTCAVPAGSWQVESDLLNFTNQRMDGTTTTTLLVANPTLKYGVGHGIDLEVGIAPVELIRSTTQSHSTEISGIGDLYLRVKDNIFDSSNSSFSASIIPYIKFPTARVPIGNGLVEEGVNTVLSYALTPSVSMSTGPEFDLFKNASNSGRHTNVNDLINLSETTSHGVTLYEEIWTDWNFDPHGTVRQSSLDAAVSWTLNKRLQLDFGLNAGLNHATPALQIYLGISQSF